MEQNNTYGKSLINLNVIKAWRIIKFVEMIINENRVKNFIKRRKQNERKVQTWWFGSYISFPKFT